MRESTTFFKDGIRRLFKNPLAVLSIVILLLLIVIIVVAPMIVPYSYSEVIRVNGQRDRSVTNLRPFTYSELEQKAIEEGHDVFPHIFGTDELGRDYFIRVIYGARVSLAVGFFASLIVLVIGLLYGSISGYVGGRTDIVMMRIVDIIYSLPDTLMVILLSVVLDQVLGDSLKGTILASIGNNMLSLFVVFGALYWVGMARLVRGQILAAREQEFVTAAKAMGITEMKIIFRHILPNCLSTLLVQASTSFAAAILAEASLSYLGLGTQPPAASWGRMLKEAQSFAGLAPWAAIFPGLAPSDLSQHGSDTSTSYAAMECCGPGLREQRARIDAMRQRSCDHLCISMMWAAGL